MRPDVKADEEHARRRLFVLQIVQPGLAGLMDGSVSTLAPVFAAAFATRNPWDAFLVGMAASLGRGHQHGICRGAFGRWKPYRARASVGAGIDLRRYDRFGRGGPHFAVLDAELSYGAGAGVRGGGDRTRE